MNAHAQLPFLQDKSARYAALCVDVEAAQAAYDRAKARTCTRDMAEALQVLKRARTAALAFEVRVQG